MLALMIVSGLALVPMTPLVIMFPCLTLLRPEDFARQLLFAVGVDVQLGGRDPAAIHPRNLQASSDIQRRDRVLEQFRRHPGIHQGAQKHVAADAGKAVEVGYAHRRGPWVVRRWSKLYLLVKTLFAERPLAKNQPPTTVFIIGKPASRVKPRARVQFATITLFFNSLGDFLYRDLERRLAQHVRDYLSRIYSLDLAKIVIEQPPRVELGEYALPLAFELAKNLRKAPRKIAEEIVTGIGPLDGFEKFELAGAGYINARVKREALASALAADIKPKAEIPPGKILVEHSSINPNKAAHIGHLRNAILGDTFVRLLHFAGREVDVQNYIDNTGVQVADVVVGFLHLEKKSRAEIEQLARQPRFDYYCWDLYARVSQWYEQDKQNLQARFQTLHAIEDPSSETSAIADLISTAVLRRHLETMDRLDIEYDFLPRESEILHLHFWDAAFTKLKEAGVLTFESEGKNKGCWVMRRAGTSKPETTETAEADAESAEQSQVAEEDQKVIVRSNGTVGYVGKDIAYHLWKFGLLGRDFGYRKF